MANEYTTGFGSAAPETTGTENTSLASAEMLPLVAEETIRMPDGIQKAEAEYEGDYTSSSSKTCRACGKVFTEKSRLQTHLLRHTGERPHPCPAFPTEFRRKHHLEDHLRTHTGEKPYKCHLCCSDFTGKSSLDEHLMAHAGRKPRKCSH